MKIEEACRKCLLKPCFNFSGMSKKYVALHLGDYSDDELGKAKTASERIESKLTFAFHACISNGIICQFVKNALRLDVSHTP